MSSPPAIVSDVLTRLVAGPSRATPGPGSDPADRHRAEYREPSIWVWRRIVGTAFAFIVVTVAWYLIKVPDGLVSDETLPTQTQVAAAFNELRVDGFAGSSLTAHVVASLARLVLGLMIGVTAGGLLGLSTGSAPLARTVIDPVGSLFRMMPAVVVAPLLIRWLGSGNVAIVASVALAVALVTMDAVDTARIRNLRGMDDHVVHQLAAGLRRAVGTGWAAVLAVETLLAPVGLGPMIWSAQDRADVIVAGLYVVGMIGLILDGFVRCVEYLLSMTRSDEWGEEWFDDSIGSLFD
jgi:ABC-type nitrate/sulfonate/bicarbonate transport system permease component